MTIKECINEAKTKNKQLDIIDLKRIIKKILNINENDLIYNLDQSISEEKRAEFEEDVIKLANGMPLQYIINEQYFMGNSFFVNEDVLIPQPDTEILVEQVIELCEKNSDTNKILDLCTGSGAIAISIKNILKEKCEVHASDISKKAIEVAKINEERILNKNNQIDFIQSDMFEDINDKYDIIVTNPPYIESNTINDLPKDVQREPKIALDGGEDGLKYYRIIKENIKDYLKEDGYLVMEIGYNQKEAVTNMFHNSRCIKDYAKKDRVVIWKNSIK